MLSSLSQTIINVLTNPPSAVWLTCCVDGSHPLIGRLSSINVIDDETIRCYLPVKFANELSPALVEGNTVAILAACTLSFDSYQLKGRIQSICNPLPEEFAGQKKRLELFSRALVRQGFSAEKLYKAYVDDEFISLIIKVESIFDQTPKPGAGFKISK